MRFLSAKLYLLTLMLLFSCKEVNRESENETLLNNTKTNSEEPIEDYLENPEQDLESNTKKVIEWSDGNSYEYDFTEVINLTDPKGNVEPVTIYRNNIPSNTNCENKKCSWCNTIIYPVSYDYEEYPDISGVRKYANNSSIVSLFWNLGGDISKYTYTDESTDTIAIRTEWILVCKYEEVNGYCSNKCYYESKNR